MSVRTERPTCPTLILHVPPHHSGEKISHLQFACLSSTLFNIFRPPPFADITILFILVLHTISTMESLCAALQHVPKPVHWGLAGVGALVVGLKAISYLSLLLNCFVLPGTSVSLHSHYLISIPYLDADLKFI